MVNRIGTGTTTISFGEPTPGKKSYFMRNLTISFTILAVLSLLFFLYRFLS